MCQSDKGLRPCWWGWRPTWRHGAWNKICCSLKVDIVCFFVCRLGVLVHVLYASTLDVLKNVYHSVSFVFYFFISPVVHCLCSLIHNCVFISYTYLYFSVLYTFMACASSSDVAFSFVGVQKRHCCLPCCLHLLKRDTFSVR